MAIVNLSGVRKSYGALTVLRDVSLAVERGAVVALVGRSGSGKSTLLRCINGLEPIDGGEVVVDGRRVEQNEASLRQLRQEIGIVFQSYNLFPHLTVERNVTLALSLVKKMSAQEGRAVAEKVLSQVGLREKMAAYPEQLSGGQQQRVAIARSLAMQPKLMLFDEVTSALDPELKEEVLKVMEGLAREGMTMILVTHEMDFARRVADQVVFMHQGRIHEQGPPSRLFAEPETPEFRQFIASTLN
ncbi:amino acid ABC transporter ATP-binding protein [Alsobacter soli]|uniref:Amino acid ABC transporter ATP-binding protein n=1 Tax=Alsobacter soli TaxID=2109933 RepID=A0A2T1HQA5_9HYPH|nr:amino acid ABC transporter ATP-binding protein [Alsobacter soli]PSC03835.1 amino acid ABC transporter ATP-binding protein [Alsobacter soli]